MAKRVLASEWPTGALAGGQSPRRKQRRLEETPIPPLPLEDADLDWPVDIGLDLCVLPQQTTWNKTWAMTVEALKQKTARLDEVKAQRNALKSKQMKLKTEKKTLVDTLARSRRVACELEADNNRLRCQRCNELKRERQARREIQAHEEAVNSREAVTMQSWQELTRRQSELDARMSTQEVALAQRQKELDAKSSSQEEAEVCAVLCDLVSQVDVNARESCAQSTQQELEWLRRGQHEVQTFIANLLQEAFNVEELVEVERELLEGHAEQLETQIRTYERGWARTRGELAAMRTQLAAKDTQLTFKTQKYDGLVTAHMSLRWKHHDALQRIKELEAQRMQWQQDVALVQREREAFAAQRNEWQQELLEAQLAELESQQQLRAQREGCRARLHQEETRMDDQQTSTGAKGALEAKKELRCSRLRTLRRTPGVFKP